MVAAEIRDLDVHFGKELVRGLRAAHVFEKGRSGNDLIDFGMAPITPDWNPGPTQFKSRIDISNYFDRLADDVKRDTPDGEYIAAKAESMSAYMKFRQNPNTDRSDFPEVARKIMGYYPRLIPWTEVTSIRVAVAAEFNRLYGQDYNRDGWNIFYLDHSVTPDDAALEITRLQGKAVSKIVAEVGVRSQPRVNIIPASEEEYWIGWLSANRSDGCTYKLNSHPVNQERYFEGVPGRNALHELDHAVQAKAFESAIDDRLINPGRGETTIPGPEQMILESVASEITRLHPGLLDLFPEDQRAAISFAAELQYLTDIVYANAWQRLLILREPVKQVSDEVQDLLPHEPKNRISLMMRLLRRPERMYYLPMYGEGEYMLRDEVETWPEEDRRLFSVAVHTQPMIPDQVKKLIRDIKVKRSVA